MTGLDREIRLFIEESIDDALDEKTEIDIRKTLSEMGIEPNLETVLSLITGTILGAAFAMWGIKQIQAGQMDISKIPIEEVEKFMTSATELLSRRAMELRQHYFKSDYL